MVLNTKKELFLSNTCNKQKFINLLSLKLEENSYPTVHADGDADLLIVEEAVEHSVSIPTIVVGDDTDLLVLLCYHGKTESRSLYFQSSMKQSAKQQKQF